MELLNNETVTVIRKGSYGYEDEEIFTTKILAGSEISEEQNRINVIGRLRKEPNVVFVLEGKDGKCEEHAVLADGFEMTVSLSEGDETTASFRVLHYGNLACEREYALSEEAESDDFYNSFIGEIKWILGCIDRADYCFVDDNCPGFEDAEPEDALTLYDIEQALKENGYQYETIHSVGWMRSPLLFIAENEVVLVGSHVYDHESLFVELKRVFQDRPKSVVERALDKVDNKSCIDVIPREDETWSFQLDLNDIRPEDDLLAVLKETISEMKNFIKKVESQDDMYESDGFETEQIRDFFIYETMETSIRLSRLHI